MSYYPQRTERSMHPMRALALLLVVIVYLAGGYGLVSNLYATVEPWLLVIAMAIYTALFAAFGWWVYSVEAS